ncbi:MAG TPA: hypothetical protein VK471_09485 [Solirubrobacterales bacterium]|nr:hypothetical protein [Solirubrobacterales bacterium]
MSRKAELPRITSGKSKGNLNTGYRLLDIPKVKTKLVRLSEENCEVIFGARVSTDESTKELAKEVVQPLKQALDRAKTRSGDFDVFVVRHDASPVLERRSTRLSTDKLAERFLPDSPVPSPAQALLARRESEARWSYLQEFGAYTSEQIADNRSRAKNRHALANRWRSEGKVFAVELRGQRLYPGFQFDPETFAPRPIVASALAALPRAEMSDWEVALWWVAGNDWLEGLRPVDAMQENPEAVASAAARLAEPSPL